MSDEQPDDGESRDSNGGIRPVPPHVEPPGPRRKYAPCHRCEGTGRVDLDHQIDCPVCRGTGEAAG